MTKDIIYEISNDSDKDRPDKPRSVFFPDQFRSDSSANQFTKPPEKVSTNPNKGEEEKKVGDIVELGGTSYFIIDIFEKEIMELGDKVDLNFNKFNKFETLYGDAPLDHHFYNYRCCYSSCWCGCTRTSKVEREWRNLERELTSMENKGVNFFVRSYKERTELMRVAVTVKNGENTRNLFFFDLIFPKEYPNRAPNFFCHSSETLKPLKDKICYNILDVFHHIQEIVLKNTNNSCQKMLEMLNQPLLGFEDFVKGYFRKNGALILQKMMEKERDRNMLWKLYIAFEDNKAYCEYLLNDELKEELKRFKEVEDDDSSISDLVFDDGEKLSKFQNFWCKFLGF